MATPAGNIFSPNAGAGEIPYPPQHEEEENDKARTGQHQAWPYTISCDFSWVAHILQYLCASDSFF